MSVIESPIGKVISSGQSTPLKRYVVSDDERSKPNTQARRYYNSDVEDDFDPGLDIEPTIPERDPHEVKAYVDKLKAQKDKVAPERKNKLEILIGLKKKIKSIVVEGHTIELKALSGGEIKSVFEFLSKDTNQTNIVQIYNSRHAILAFSLHSIDGELIEDLVGEENNNLETRLAIIENLSDVLVGELHSFYEKEVCVDRPKNELEIKEALQDLKK